MIDPQARYSRHFPVIGEDGQEKLKQGKVLCVGAGGLASGILPYLVASGVGEIGIVDGDTIEISNLQRQVLFCEEQLGLGKAECAKASLERLNSDVKINAHPFFLDFDNANAIMLDYDLVIDATDNFKVRYILNEVAKQLGKPLISASIYQFEAQISVFNYEGGPCYECLYPNPPAPGSIPNCSQAGVLGVLPGIIGGIQASEAIKVLLKKGQVLSGALLYIDLLTNHFYQLSLEKSTDCDKLHGKLGGILSTIKTYSVEQLHALLNEQADELVLIDVRELAERAEDHIGGLHNPISEFDLDKIPKNKALVIYCRSGMRSRSVAEYLVQQGFPDVANLEGGIIAWRKCYTQD